MTDALEVIREDGDTRGRYVIELPDGLEAELTYGRSDGRIVADHTFVPPSFRGRGIAERLVEALIADARASGETILPLCSYVAAQFRRHPEWSDLRA
jgi:predicted GNAT family acetyltransferase